MNKKKIEILGKKFNKPISCLTAYSAPIAKILDGNIDIVLIGDSLGTTLYGMKNSRKVTMDMMKYHGRSVTKNIDRSITVIDMPYKTYRNKFEALRNGKKLLDYTNANMLKLEINHNKINIVKYLSEKNFNIIAHIGVTPQSFIDFKKIKSVGKTTNESEKLIQLSLDAERAGAKCILLECVNQKTAKKITSIVSIPTIGIGSSKYCDGQVLVFDDIINIDNQKHSPKFLKKYFNFNKLAKKAIKKFSKEVKEKKFPSKKYSYN